ncbi:MAG: ATP-binding protein [Lachnospiraceae bacterium]|nr:ATP-binding protein [Lachnospiraceae bacterium]
MALASSVWSLGYAVMFFTENEHIYGIFRIIGFVGIMLVMIFGQISIGILSSSNRKLRIVLACEVFLGLAVLVMVAIPGSYTMEHTAGGIVTAFTSSVTSVLYTLYCLLIAAFFVYLTIRMRSSIYPKRINSVGNALLVLLALIFVGMIVDTLLPAVGINFNIPASSILQFGGMVILMQAINRLNQDTISIENMSQYIYQTINSPVIVFDNKSVIKLVNEKAKEVFELPEDVAEGNYNFWKTCFNKEHDHFLLLSDTNATIELEYMEKDMHFNANVAPIFDSYKDYLGYIAVFMDVTEQFRSMRAASDARHDAELAQQEAEHANELALMAEKTSNMKSDFLANMSHEIRTPMNAIIGMAEMSLRTDLPAEAKDYISQIKSSGNALLNIINDILDFSKIESGKMEIIEDDYELLSNIHDVGNILMTRLQDKDVELLTSINPTLPCYLRGDQLRIRQILINLANNAVKFTKQGFVRIILDYEKIDDENIKLKFSVRDSGIGIKKEDLEKLFESFQQVDSKRNRNVEGTGLGLAISKRLVNLMGGEITVKSEYGVGSEFSFWIPQKVVEWQPSVTVENNKEIGAVGYFAKSCIARQVFADLKALDIESVAISNINDYSRIMGYNKAEMEGKKLYFFTEASLFDYELLEFADSHPEIKFVVFRSFASVSKTDRPNVKFAKKPISTILMGMTLNNDDVGIRREDAVFEFEFIAPDAHILIVDDNEVNLSVAEGLLKPLEMKITTANSGIKALEYLGKEKFDIVFMDHMMPELDGIETTRIIRRLHPDLKDMPVIALTANAVGDAKKMFLAEGMDDFVAKPIELKTLVSKVRRWLPEEKIVRGQGLLSEESGYKQTGNNKEKLPEIGDLDIEAALALIGSMDIYNTILEKYYHAIKNKANVIKTSEVNEDVSTYTIEVHALKSSSRQIGATELSAMAAKLEQAGKDKDLETIHKETDKLLEKYLSYVEVIKPFVVSDETVEVVEKLEVDFDELKELFAKLHAACDELDMDAMEAVSKEMDKFAFDETSLGFYEQVKESVSNLDSFTCEDILYQWESEIG